MTNKHKVRIGIERHKNKHRAIYSNKQQEQQSWLYEIRKRLSAFYTPEEIEQWLTTPHPLLDNKTAMECVENLEISRVRQVLSLFEDSAYL